MRKLAALVAGLVLAVVVFTPAATSADTKWARGSVTATTPDSVTISIGTKSMTFKVDSATEVIGRGVGTKLEQAKITGKEGVAFRELVKVGDRVEVHYTDAAGVMKAVEIRTGVDRAPGVSEEPEGSSAKGVVTAVSATSLTVKTSEGDKSFAIEPKTRVFGHGLGTKADELAQAGQPKVLTEFLKLNDEVVVSYHMSGDKRVAKEVRVVKKAM